MFVQLPQRVLPLAPLSRQEQREDHADAGVQQVRGLDQARQEVRVGAQAAVAFGGGPGSGEKKKEFVISAIKESVEFQNMVKADLMTPEQEAKLVEAADYGVEFIFSSIELAKLFQAPKV